jgi:transcriptional regulator with XRE-family HTH domain
VEVEAETTDGTTVVIDGPTLRSARESQGVRIRQIARAAKMSHGHLSKVERGEYGRPVTPTIIFAYEKVLGLKIADAVASGELLQSHRVTKGPEWRPGEMSAFQRRTWRGQVAACAAGGSVGMPPARTLYSAGRVATPPATPERADSLDRLADLLEHAGGLSGAIAHALLPWATTLPNVYPRPEPAMAVRLSVVLGRLCRRAGIEARASNRHESARVLLLLALNYAATADHPDLRALILADIADQAAEIGYPEDALATLRLAEGDERISESARAALKAVRARAGTTE